MARIELPEKATMADYQRYIHQLEEMHGWLEVDLIHNGFLIAEELGELNRAYQDAATASIEKFGGYVARYMGDGVLAYFGYPRAQEDAAERAVLAWTDALILQGGRASDALFDALHAHFSDEDILELTYHVMGYNLHAVCCKALRLEFDDVDERIVEVPAPAEGEASDWAGSAWSKRD